MYCPSRCRNSAYHCGAANYPVSWVAGSIGLRIKKKRRNFGPTNPHGTTFVPKQWFYQKENMGLERTVLRAIKAWDLIFT